MGKTEIIISGVGGQGCVSGGNTLAYAASVYDGHEALMASAYGSEARGTFTKSEVIISDWNISFINCLEPDFVVAMDPISYKHYVNDLKTGVKFIYDADAVIPTECKADQIGYPLTSLALESGNISNINSVVLGILVTIAGVATPASVEKCIREKFHSKPDVAESNVTAFNIGLHAKPKSRGCGAEN